MNENAMWDAGRCHVFKEEGKWWCEVPDRLLMGHERGVYVRRTFAGILRVMDNFIARSRARSGPMQRFRLLQRKEG